MTGLGALAPGPVLAAAAPHGGNSAVVAPPSGSAHAVIAPPSGDPAVIAPPSRAAGATTARVVATTNARARPGGPRRVARLTPLTSWSGQAQTLLVLDSAWRGERQWLKVRLPLRPNGVAGWILRDKAALGHTPYWLELRLRRRRLTVYRDGRRVRSVRAVVGAARTPTPRGLAAIYERNRQPDAGGFLGPWALSLTALSNVLESYGGGPGRVAIHGRGGASLRDPLGSARSHGCIRIPNEAVAWLAARAAPGTPVDVRR
jgi:lipoprotein-anchoring transpeptidase ErfK/SrfK